MHPSASESYLETEVLTATPQRRQVMLLEAAIRAVERTRHHWRTQQDGQACESLVRAQQIVTELIAGLNHQVAPELTGRVAALYVFVFRRLTEASLDRDEAKLDEALRVLQPQREAWLGVCEQLASASSADAANMAPSSQGPCPDAPVLPSSGGESAGSGDRPTGLSVEA